MIEYEKITRFPWCRASTASLRREMVTADQHRRHEPAVVVTCEYCPTPLPEIAMLPESAIGAYWSFVQYFRSFLSGSGVVSVTSGDRRRAHHNYL